MERNDTARDLGCADAVREQPSKRGILETAWIGRQRGNFTIATQHRAVQRAQSDEKLVVDSGIRAAGQVDEIGVTSFAGNAREITDPAVVEDEKVPFFASTGAIGSRHDAATTRKARAVASVAELDEASVRVELVNRVNGSSQKEAELCRPAPGVVDYLDRPFEIDKNRRGGARARQDSAENEHERRRKTSHVLTSHFDETVS